MAEKIAISDRFLRFSSAWRSGRYEWLFKELGPFEKGVEQRSGGRNAGCRWGLLIHDDLAKHLDGIACGLLQARKGLTEHGFSGFRNILLKVLTLGQPAIEGALADAGGSGGLGDAGVDQEGHDRAFLLV